MTWIGSTSDYTMTFVDRVKGISLVDRCAVAFWTPHAVNPQSGRGTSFY